MFLSLKVLLSVLQLCVIVSSAAKFILCAETVLFEKHVSPWEWALEESIRRCVISLGVFNMFTCSDS